MFENLVFYGRICVIFISAFIPVSEDLDVSLFLDPAANLISIQVPSCWNIQVYVAVRELHDCSRGNSCVAVWTFSSGISIMYFEVVVLEITH